MLLKRQKPVAVSADVHGPAAGTIDADDRPADRDAARAARGTRAHPLGAPRGVGRRLAPLEDEAALAAAAGPARGGPVRHDRPAQHGRSGGGARCDAARDVARRVTARLPGRREDRRGRGHGRRAVRRRLHPRRQACARHGARARAVDHQPRWRRVHGVARGHVSSFRPATSPRRARRPRTRARTGRGSPRPPTSVSRKATRSTRSGGKAPPRSARTPSAATAASHGRGRHGRRRRRHRHDRSWRGRTRTGPSLREGAVQVNGRLPPEVIQRIVRQNFGRFRLCYEDGLKSNPELAGRVTVKFHDRQERRREQRCRRGIGPAEHRDGRLRRAQLLGAVVPAARGRHRERDVPGRLLAGSAGTREALTPAHARRCPRASAAPPGTPRASRPARCARPARAAGARRSGRQAAPRGRSA